MKSFIGYCLLAVCYLLAAGSSFGQNSKEECVPSAEHLQEELISINGFDFRWSSGWNVDSKTAPMYCICRQVVNLGSKPLYYRWKVGDFENEALPPKNSNKNSDTLCMRADDYSKPPLDTNLYYGRQGYSTPTHVWLSASESNISTKHAYAAFPDLVKNVSFDNARSYSPTVDASELHPTFATVDFHLSVISPRQYIFFVPLPRKRIVVRDHIELKSTVTMSDAGYYSVINQTTNLNPQSAACVETADGGGDDPLDGGGDPSGGGGDPSGGGGNGQQGGAAPAITGRGSNAFWHFLRRHLWLVGFDYACSRDRLLSERKAERATTARPELKPEHLTISGPVAVSHVWYIDLYSPPPTASISIPAWAVVR